MFLCVQLTENTEYTITALVFPANRKSLLEKKKKKKKKKTTTTTTTKTHEETTSNYDC